MSDERILCFAVESERPILKNHATSHCELHAASVYGASAGHRAQALSDGCDQATHVGIMSIDCAFEERRVYDTFPDGARSGCCGCIMHAHTDNMRNALAIAHNVIRELKAHGRQGFTEGLEPSACSERDCVR